MSNARSLETIPGINFYTEDVNYPAWANITIYQYVDSNYRIVIYERKTNKYTQLELDEEAAELLHKWLGERIKYRKGQQKCDPSAK